MCDGGLEALVGQRATQPALPEHRHGFDIDEIRSGDLIGGAQLIARGVPVVVIVGQSVGEDGCVDDDHRAVTGRSSPRAFIVHVGHCRLQADATAVLGLDLVEDLADRALFGEVAQLDGEVLLQRLVATFGLALKSGVDILGDITDKDVRHACILLTSASSTQGAAASLPRRAPPASPTAERQQAADIPAAGPGRRQ